MVNELQEMREDLIERITTMIFHVGNGELTELVLYLCKIATMEDQKIFEKRLREAAVMDIKPIDLQISPYFCLDSNSNLM